tara:strand:- start:231 stop:401 length:171 start_codon:yes stop_codon:yes gene_type:complete
VNKCPECNSNMIEVEYGSSASDVTEIGLECDKKCGLSIQPEDMEDYILTKSKPEII